MTDNGIGFDPETARKLFTFAFTTKKTGNGFGLHFCALAAKEMGGEIKAHSDGKGKGATFELEIPFIQPLKNRDVKVAEISKI